MLEQTDLFELNPPAGANHPDTSHEAAESMKPIAQPLRQKVFSVIAGMPNGAICEEIEQHLDLKSGCASARINELATKWGVIKDSGIRRKTTSGRNAIVWIMRENAWRTLDSGWREGPKGTS
ncbi:MAG: hypothetical protein V3U60_16070 [Gammaproteobacteria bacterium]